MFVQLVINLRIMADVAIILGKSGTGKSTSLKTLDPKSTVVINIKGKRLPFKGSAGMYNTENKNLFNVDNPAEVVSLLKAINGTTHIKTVIIDDFIYMMRTEYFNRIKEKGFDKYNDLANHSRMVIDACEKMRDDLHVFLILHSEDVTSNGSVLTYKVATIGTLLDKQYNPVEIVPVVLYSDVLFDENGIPKYGFFTKRSLKDGVEIPAKSPDGMFTDSFIPNDLGLVVKAMTEYYG